MVPLVDAMKHTGVQRPRPAIAAADIYDRMLRDTECGVILCLAGSLISAGLKQVFVDMVRNRMVDAIVSTGANIVDQDFFEALGFRHYIADERLKAGTGRRVLRELHIDRIYDTLIDEDELRICDETVRRSPTSCRPRLHSRASSSARWAPTWPSTARRETRIVLAATSRTCRSSAPRSPIARRASAWWPISTLRGDQPKVAIDSAKDFYELTQIKIKNPTPASS